MRYDEKAKKINIDYRELVAIAKRGISAPDSFEDEAGSLERPRRALLDTEGKEYHDTPLAYELSSNISSRAFAMSVDVLILMPFC